jgi:hypothetical protein
MKRILPALAALLFLAGSCATPRIALTGEGFTEMPVKGRNGFLMKQKLSFGEYSTGSVKRSWTKGGTTRKGFGSYNADGTYDNIISMEYTNKKQTVNFSLGDESGNSSEVRCVTKFRSDDLVIGNNPNSLPHILIDLARGLHSTNTFYVQIFVNNAYKPWQLLLDNNAVQAKAKTYIGKIAQDDDHYYSIIPVNKMMNKKGEAKNILFGSIGLDIQDKAGRSVATVSMLDKGKVYLNTSDKKEAFLMANICAALLLQEQIAN